MADADPLIAPHGPFAGGGEMGARIMAYPWETSPLGPVAGWSPALLNAVSLILPAEAQIVLFWGPQHVAIYNDAYAPAIGINHPGALGRPAIEHWAELWDDLQPLFQGVLDTGRTFAAKDRPFYVERKGYGEEVFFDVSYSAVREGDGTVAGIMCIVSETTERVRSERRISEENARLSTLFAAAPSFMAVLRGPNHVFELANPSYQKLVHHRARIGMPVAKALPELAEQGFVARLDDIYRTGLTYSANNALVMLQNEPGGVLERRRLNFVYQPIVDATGAVTGIFVEGHDVTAAHEIQEQLASEEESLRLAQEGAGLGRWDYDALTGTLDWSTRTREIFAVAPDQPVTLDDFFDKLHPDDRTPIGEAFSAALDPSQRAIYDVEYRVRDAAGNERWIAARGRAVFDTGGTCRRAAGVVADVTERRARQDALRESEARFRSVADFAPAVIWMTDEAGQVTYMNRYAAEKYGVPQETLRDAGWAGLVHPDDLPGFRAEMPAILQERAPFIRDVRTVDRDGRIRWMHCESRPRVIDGVFHGYIGCAIDVTEAHDAAVELERAVAQRTGELASANAELTAQISEREKVEATLTQMQRLEAVGQLTSGVAHDFNNLLTVVLGNLDMLERRDAAALGERGRQRLEHMRKAAERGAALTAQLLAFSRRTRLAAGAVDLNDTVATMRPLLESTLGGTIAIDTDLADALWTASVDATQIELAILNLAINARDAMQVGGRLTIATSNKVVEDDPSPGAPPSGEYVVVCVIDDGAGMPPEVAARAFEPFFTTKPVGKGSGLGLAQVYGFARQSGGGVTIETREGAGTTVRIFLPRAAAAVADPRDPATGASPAAAPGMTALVVDDDAAVRSVTADMLHAMGYSVVETGSGRAALERLTQGRVDLVVADFAMPGMNGAELIRRLARRFPAIPTIIVTGYADLSAVAHLGSDRVIQKPFRDGEFERKIAALMERRG